jgi:regulator of sigma E protease
VHYLVQAGYFVLLIGALVFVHELGHFACAKACRVKVLRFSLGFGPRLLRFSRKGTEYCISLIPFGGFVKLLGEDPADEVPAADRGRAFHEKPLWQRFIVVLAGPAANLLLPIGIYFVFFAQQRMVPAAIVGSVFTGQAADGRLIPGDRIIAVDGQPIRYWRDFEEYIADRPGSTVRMTVQRGRDVIQVAIPVGSHERSPLLPTRTGLVGISPRWLRAQIGVIDPQSPAAQAGLKSFDLVTTVDTGEVRSYAELEQALGRHEQQPKFVTYLRGRPSGLDFVDLELLEPGTARLLPEKGIPLGIRPAEFFLQDVEPGTPLYAAGLRAGEEIRGLDGAPLGSWELFGEALAHNPKQQHTVEWQSGAAERRAPFQVAVRRELDEYRQRQTRLEHGARPRPLYALDPLIAVEHPIWTAAGRAVSRTGEVTSDMVRATAALVRGRIPHDTIGGPILVLQIAGVAAERGWDFFLATLALISINIGLINLLPIPALDGGHLLFFGVEAMRRRPVSPRTRAAANYVGLAVIACLVLLALKNDVVRYLFP